MSIKTFKSKALKKFWEQNNRSGVKPEHIKKVDMLLDLINRSKQIEDLENLYRFHEYKGAEKGVYSYNVSGNVRILFRFNPPDAFDLWYGDPHGEQIKKILGAGK